MDTYLRGQSATCGMYMSEKARIVFDGRSLKSADGLLLPPPMQTLNSAETTSLSRIAPLHAVFTSLAKPVESATGAAPNTHLPYDYVFNLRGETRYSQPDEVYRLCNYTLSMTLGNEAAKRKCPAFIECSTGMVYKPSSTPRKETDKLKPWLKLAP